MTDHAKLRKIYDLAERCSSMKKYAEEAKAGFDEVKDELKRICEEEGMSEIATPSVNVKIIKQNRFKCYDNSKEVLEMVPEDLRDDVRVLDRKSINGLIKKKLLPNSIKDHEMHTVVTSMVIKDVE